MPDTSLDFPFGQRLPRPGELFPVGHGIGWLRFPVDDVLGFINLWILEGDGDGYAIVDTGIATSESRALWEQVIAGPLAGKEAKQLICTHHHPDHSGLADWLTRRLSIGLCMTRTEWLMARVTALELSVDQGPEVVALWQFAGWSDEEIEAGLAQGWGLYGEAMEAPPPSFATISHGVPLDACGRELEVIVGRGHSPEHACLWDEKAGMLIGGDLILPDNLSGIGPRPFELEADPLAEWNDSVEALKSLPEDTLVLPSHGRPFRGLHRRLAAIDDAYARRLERLSSFLVKPRTIVDCFEVIFRNPVSLWLRQNATAEVLAYLNRLRAERRIVRTIEEGVARFQLI